MFLNFYLQVCMYVYACICLWMYMPHVYKCPQSPEEVSYLHELELQVVVSN